jgi:hypothetical protein
LLNVVVSVSSSFRRVVSAPSRDGSRRPCRFEATASAPELPPLTPNSPFSSGSCEYENKSHTNVRLTEESIGLWELRTREYVQEVGR